MATRDMESWEQLFADEIAAIDAQDDECLEDFGLEYEDWEELAFGVKEQERDRHRWELDPASAEDFCDHARALRNPARPWRHFGH
jgi:hypothetical protein